MVVKEGVKEGVNDGYRGHCEPLTAIKESLLFHTPTADDGTGLMGAPKNDPLVNNISYYLLKYINIT